MWRSKQFLCEMVNDLFVYDLMIPFPASARSAAEYGRSDDTVVAGGSTVVGAAVVVGTVVRDGVVSIVEPVGTGAPEAVVPSERPAVASDARIPEDPFAVPVAAGTPDDRAEDTGSAGAPSVTVTFE